MSEPLDFYPITHAHLRPILHPRLGAVVNARSAVAYLRFLRPVRLDRLELPYHVYGRWEPSVPIHPAHIIASVPETEAGNWRVVREFDLPAKPRIRGQGLSQSMTGPAVEAGFQQLLRTLPPIVLDLKGLRTSSLRLECDREHPVWPNHGETQSPINVPFGLFNPIRAFGHAAKAAIPEARYNPILKMGRIAPRAPRSMTVTRRGDVVLFAGAKLSVGFALRRPMLMHLGWDALGAGQASHNRLGTRRVAFVEANRGMSGPLAVTTDGDYGSHHWTGHVTVSGNRVAYQELQALPGLRIDAVFHVAADRLTLDLTQTADRDLLLLEAEAWRLTFALVNGMTAVAGVPTEAPGRSGDVALPALIAGDGNGCLACRLLAGDTAQARLQVDSYRPSNEVTAGIVLGARAATGGSQGIAAGRTRVVLEWAVTNLQPRSSRGTRRPGLGVRRHWASAFANYRPEWGGFSNHAASVNCHVNQHGQIDVAACTAQPRGGPDPLDMARFTIGRALLDGSGYGYWRNLYLDADPILVAAAGRIHAAAPRASWLEQIAPGLMAAAARMLGTIGSEGLAISRDLSGNTGSHRWSSNACDVVGFGHMDAYVNAWAYRALRNAVALLNALGQDSLAQSCRRAARRLRANYARHLLNPETGWVAGWRSRDGQLHDPGMLWVNGPACAFGVLAPAVARRALRRLESLRARLGIQSARTGVPFSLLPLKRGDHMLPVMNDAAWRGAGRTESTFEYFTDGSMATSAATYYLRALSIHGFKREARAMAADLDAALADGLYTGGAGHGMGKGNEFLSWEGLASGYEGTFGPNFGVLYGIAIEQGALTPPEPEWWPAGG